MKLDDLHDKLVNHYRQTRQMKTKRRNIQIQSIVGQTYKKKTVEQSDPNSYQDFIRNQKHVAAEAEPLMFRQLPRKLKCYFPGPPNPPPNLQPIPYTYEIVENVSYKVPKQKKGDVGIWALEQSYFAERPSRRASNKIASKSMMDYKSEKRSDSVPFKVSTADKRKKFRSQVKKIAKIMREKNLSFKEIKKNKGLVKKTHNFYNSVDFFLMARTGDRQIESLLDKNPELAFDVDDQHMTGLHWAAREGHVYICRILLQKYRANVISKDQYGRTPLHLAVENKNIECIIRLFIEGGQMNSLDNRKRSVRAVAPDSYIKYLLEKLEEIRFIVKAKKITDRQQQRQQIQTSIRQTLDESSLYF